MNSSLLAECAARLESNPDFRTVLDYFEERRESIVMSVLMQPLETRAYDEARGYYRALKELSEILDTFIDLKTGE